MNLLLSVFNALVRTLALAFVDWITASNPMIIIAGLVMLIVVVTVAVQAIIRCFGALTRPQRLDFVELVKALRRGQK